MRGRLPETARAWGQMTHGSCQQMTEAGNPGGLGGGLSFPKGKASTGRLTDTEPRPHKAWLQQELTQHTGRDSLYSLYTEPAPRTGHIPYKQSSLYKTEII